MNRIFILRHAKAGAHTTNDHDRPLTEVGRHQARMLGQWFREQNTDFDSVITSSALRTVETVENLGLSLGYTIEPKLYSAPARVIESVIREIGLETGTLLVVGHNPGVSDLVMAAGFHGSMNTCSVVELFCEESLTKFAAESCEVTDSFRPEV